MPRRAKPAAQFSGQSSIGVVLEFCARLGNGALQSPGSVNAIMF
jgi:hypothetical protein